MKYFKFPFIANLALVLISVIALGYILKIGQTLIAPFFLAFLLAMLFLPFVSFLERKLHFPRTIASLLSFVIVLVVLSGLGYFFSTQLADFGNDIPHLQEQFEDVFVGLQNWVSDTFNIHVEQQFEYLNQFTDKVLSSSGTIISLTLGFFSSTIGFFFFCIFFFIFILQYRRVLNKFVVDVFPERNKEQVVEAVAAIQKMTKSYIAGICIQVTIISVLATILLTILNVKYAVLLGVLTGLLNVIPYIGIGISLVVASFIAFATAAPITALYTAIGYLIIHAIDGNLILPFVIGSKVKINALFSFIGILVGEQLWGISGMFLSIPVMAIIKIIFERVEMVKPWGELLGESEKKRKKKRRVKITKDLTIEEKD